ncbi:MAG: proline--tRNA ligase [Chloroflexi bacterium]|nr:proline--tRNA ligase [Chloroflexota bacterium]
MRLSHHFGNTLREAPAGVEAISHQLLLRAGYIRQLGQGLFSYLPLAKRSLTKIENIFRDEMNAIGGQEMTMPVVHPAEVWKATGRYFSVGPEMARFKDRKERDMVLAMTHEEVVADLCKSDIRSYKQLPQLIYHIQTKFRDDPRPRAGLIRVREFTMKDSYSLDLDDAGLDKQYRAHYQAYFNIFNRCSVPAIAVGSDVGMMGGSLAHEYMYLTPVGEDTLVLCRNCGYAANRQIARFAKKPVTAEELKPLEKVATPNCKTIEELANFLGLPKSKTAKAVFMIAGHEESAGVREEFIFAIVRGDMDVNETKLANVTQADWLRPATDEEIRKTGATPGYASPIGLKNVKVIVDDAVPSSPNLVAGANDDGYHLLNTNTPRDYAASMVADIAAAGEGDACINCGHELYTARGVEVGNIFKLGTRYTSAINANYLAADGTEKPIVMGSYGIGSGRLLACVAEEHHDDKGLILPITVAPFHVHLVSLGGNNDDATNQVAERIYQSLNDANVEVLYDDRAESPGVKFADADLIGIPIRLTVSAKSLKNGGIEIKRRDQKQASIVAEADLIAKVHAEIKTLLDEIRTKVVEVPFK